VAVGVSADLSRFDEALRWFLSRVILTDDELDDLNARARMQAWWFSGGEQLRLVQDVFDDLARALNLGLPFSDFKKQVSAKLASAWGGANPHRVETIWINAMQRAYGGGRYRQLTTPTMKRFRPYWMYDAVLDSRTSPMCKERDSKVLAADDPWWDSNYPPLHHRCRSGVRALTKRQAAQRGITTTPDFAEGPQGGFGASPRDDMGATVKPNLAKFDNELAADLRRRAERAGVAA